MENICQLVDPLITNIINQEEPKGSQITDLNLFRNVMSDGTAFRIERVQDKKGSLAMTVPYCCDYDLPVNQLPGRDWLTFQIPATGLGDFIRACDLMGTPRFGQLGREFSGFKTIAEEASERSIIMRDTLMNTLEYRAFTALTGIVRDADGSVLLDMWAHFGQNQCGFEFDLDNPDFNLDEFTNMIHRTYQRELIKGNNRYSKILFLVDQCFFDAFKSHPSVKKPYGEYCCAVNERQSKALNDSSNTNNPMFEWNNVVFMEYWNDLCIPDHADDALKGATKDVNMLQECTGIGFPIGVTGQPLYEQVIAPRAKFSEMDRPAQQMFHFESEMIKDEEFRMKVEANWIPIVKQPRVLTCIRFKGDPRDPGYAKFEKDPSA